jgi:uncharacterized membrane protein
VTVEYLIVKWLHVLSSTILFGTGIGTAFFIFFTARTADAAIVAAVMRYAVMADWLFTATTMVVQPVTGFYLTSLAGMAWQTKWIAWSIALYVVAGLCWLPVVWLQIRMRDLARQAAGAGERLPRLFWTLRRVWFALGVPALFAFLAVFYLMVAKPA